MVWVKRKTFCLFPLKTKARLKPGLEVNVFGVSLASLEPAMRETGSFSVVTASGLVLLQAQGCLIYIWLS